MNFMGIGPLELIFVLVIALIVLGPKRLVEASRGMGRLARQARQVTESWPAILEREVGDNLGEQQPKAGKDENPETTSRQEAPPSS